MLKLDAKYEQLKLMLALEGFNMSEFEDDILGNYFYIDTNKNDLAISVYMDNSEESLEIYVEQKINMIWDRLEQRYYKTAKGAFNKIKKILNWLLIDPPFQLIYIWKDGGTMSLEFIYEVLVLIKQQLDEINEQIDKINEK